MATLTIPDPDALIMLGLTPVVPDQANRSIWTSRTQVVGQPGAETWSIKAAIEPLSTEDEERPWRAFLMGLRGRQNTFNFPLPCQHHIGGKPRVNGATGSGYELPLDGLQPSTRILSAGHFLTVPLPSGHNRCVMLMEDLIADASGEATAVLNFELGEVPDDDAEVETYIPFIPVRSVNGGIGMTWENAVAGASLDLEEAL